MTEISTPRRLAASPLRAAPRRAAWLLLALAAAGCAGAGGSSDAARAVPGGTIVYSQMIDTTYDPRQVVAWTAAMPLEVRGAPPDGSDAKAVAAGMTLPARFRSTPFQPGADPRSGPRIVVAFNPANRLDGCDGPAVTGAPRADGAIEALVAYCWEGRERSSVLVRSTATRGPGDAAFAGVMNQAFQQLLPTRNPDAESDRQRRPRFN